MQPLSILVVDDVDAFARLLADGLRQLGHAVACASNGRDATALVAKLRFDVVVTDIVMASGSGFDLIDDVKRLQPRARLIAMSGGGNLYSADACLRAADETGVDALLQKPFGPKELGDAIERLYREPKESS